jgi:hypothetical protein
VKRVPTLIRCKRISPAGPSPPQGSVTTPHTGAACGGDLVFRMFLSRRPAVKITRERDVPDGGTGCVTRFEVRRDFLARDPTRQAGGEYRIPAAELAQLNAGISGPIIEEARYRGPVTGQELAAAGHRLPAGWRSYLQQRSWFCRGWLPGSGCFVELLTPGEALRAASGWPA